MQDQITSSVLMIRPINFTYNAETAVSNAFQEGSTHDDDNEKAQKAFDHFVKILKQHKVNVTVISDTEEPHTPDSIFPNNWFSTHHSGKVILYPMEAVNRRAERRLDIIDTLKKDFQVSEIIDLSESEKEGKYLEGTGSLILDRVNRIAYACLSSRTDSVLLQSWGERMNYKICSFYANDKNQKPVYHTNVMMCLGVTFAVICLESISDPDQRLKVKNIIEASGKRIVEITLDQMNSFAGNMLLIKNKSNQKLLVMSQKAKDSLTEKQVRVLEEYARIISVDLGVIETLGGGSARCMLAEIHLPKK